MYLEEELVDELEITTPTKWQLVILRNFGLVPTTFIAKVLNTKESVINKEAKRLGIDYITYNPTYLDKSYLTIIRNNWNLLPYNQLLTLLNKDEEWLNYQLKNNDFLGVKLGNFKPKCEEVIYSKLDKKDIIKTNKIRRIINKEKITNYSKPFDFKPIEIKSNNSNGLRIIYPYSLSCGDLFLEDKDLISDEEFKVIKSSGINALWVHGLLSELSFNKFKKNNDDLYKVRRNNLQRFINKAREYGIKIFLYINEPRALLIDEVKDEYKYLIGRKVGNEVALCFSFKEVQDYLYESIKDLLTNVNDLGGFISITASENLTHCKHKLGSECPYCKDIPVYKTTSLINNIIQKAIDDSNSQSILIANLWGWASYTGFTDKDVRSGIKLLDKKINVLSVSEFGTHINKNGVYKVEEYSISKGEPCLETIYNLKYAFKKGHKVLAKIQVNNSWECSSVPYLPVFELIINHIKKLQKLGVNDYMMSWTLGGYPSVNVNLVSNIDNNFDYDKWLNSIYGNDAEQIKTGVHYLCKALKLLPYSQSLLYMSPLQIGPTNLLYKSKTNRVSTMVTYPYDDISSWLGNYDRDAFVSSMSKLIKIYKKGIKVLSKIDSANYLTNELIRNAKAYLINIESLLNQYLYIEARDKGSNDLNKYLIKEYKLTKELYLLVSSDSKIGFEASNQYYYTQHNFLEKIINIKQLMGMMADNNWNIG